ncbi:MAG: Ig-like domain-containing protein, partial [Alistipes sp.]|nr:Ig-like domain-containing protein [Alistipes sp.]
MKVVRKRILAVILSLAMVLPALCVTTEVRAATDYTEYGSYAPGDWDAQGKRTTVWKFTSNTKTCTFGEDDTLDNITIKGVPSKDKPAMKSGYMKFTPPTELRIPVSEDTVSAELTITSSKTDSSRGIKVGEDEVMYSSKSHTWTVSGDAISSGYISAVSVGGELRITEITLVETKSTGGTTGGDTPITAITVAPKTASVKIGDTVPLTATLTPANTTQSAISWSSSEPSVATVDSNGKVTAVAEGTTTITAVSAANSAISDTCEITVTANTSGGDIIAITGVTLDKKNASVKVGEEIDLTATVTPTNTTLSKVINWTSSNNNIATVDANGHVTAVSVGEATITAESAADSNFSATCKVVVIANGGGGNSGNMEAGGWNETIYAQIAGISKSDVTAVSYSGTMSGQLNEEDLKYLVRDLSGGVRLDIPGIKAGVYTLTVTTKDGTLTQEGIVVNEQDRSGYAHFNYTAGVGAYKDDGTLKDNAIVLYVTNENKNTVQLTYGGITVTGIGNILNSVGQDAGGGKNANGGTANTNQDIMRTLARANVPLVVRIIGTVSDSTIRDITTNDIEGLTVYDSVDMGGSEGDNGHMARIRSGKDITIEGIGYDAVIDGWGFHFMCSSGDADLGKSFEVRNLSFINTPEDAIGMEGVQASKNASSEITASVERCWVHNNSFYVPNLPVAAESDKHEGDGSVDFKRGQYFTCSYNYFEGCHKTNLVGSADYSLQYNLTYHHNYWKYCKARGPLSRRANIHMYNNIFEGQTDYAMNTRADAYIFSEYNMFYLCKSPHAVEGGAIKSYNDSIAGYLYKLGSKATEVSDRSQIVPNNCKYSAGNIDYSKFDTDASKSYIPSGKYDIQENVTEAKKVIFSQTGVMKQNPVTPDQVTMADISLLPNGVTPVEMVELPVEKTAEAFGKGGKLSKTVYAFTVYTKFDVEVSYGSDDPSSTGVLVNEAGEVFLMGSGKAYSLPAGTYMIHPTNFQPGDSTQLGTFKEVVVNSLKINSADPNYDPYELRGISLSEKTATMMVDATKQLTVTYSPSNTTADKTVTWTSSDASVASVSDNGLITAKKIGTATITATVAGKFTAVCKVTVSQPVDINGIVLSSDSLILTAGSKETLEAAVLPANTTESGEVTWKSSNTSVATVDNNGNVTAVAEGTAAIAAEVTGSKGTFTAECTITVEKGPQLPTGDMVHNFTTDGMTNASGFYTFAGSKKDKVSGNYNGTPLTTALKMDSKGKVSFTAPGPGKLTLVYATANAGVTFYINSDKMTVSSNGVVEYDVAAAGTVEIAKGSGSGEGHLCYIAFVPEGGESGGDTVAINGIMISQKTASLKAGESVVITATVSPDNTTLSKSVNWKSSDPQVATVSGGKVTAVSAGTATITAVSVGDGKFYTTCEITVTADGSGETPGGNEGEKPGDNTGETPGVDNGHMDKVEENGENAPHTGIAMNMEDLANFVLTNEELNKLKDGANI